MQSCFTVYDHAPASSVPVAPMGPEQGANAQTQSEGTESYAHASGGGTGFPFHLLRPSGAYVGGTRGGDTGGPLSFLEVYNSITDAVKQGGVRRGAALAILKVSHPDVFDFIRCKSTLSPKNRKLAEDLEIENTQRLIETQFSNFNLSVGITDAFMEAVLADGNFDLEFDGKVYQTVKAKAIFEAIVEGAWRNGEPGVFFMDTVNRNDPEGGMWGAIEAPGDCLAADTRLLTMDGPITIAEVAERGETELWTPAGWRLATARPIGQREVVDLVLSNGQHITLTPDHPILVGEGWVQAGNALGMLVEPFRARGSWYGDDQGFSLDDLVRLGFLQGDGHSQQDGGMYANIGAKDRDVDMLFAAYKTHRKGKGVARYVPLHDRLTRQAERLGILRVPLPERSLPAGLWTLPPDGAKAFLRGLYSANGSVIRSQGALSRVALKTTCRALAQDLQVLLLALGFRPYVTTNHPSQITWPNGTYTGLESYDVNIVLSELGKFAREIGFIQQYKTEGLADGRVPVGPTRRKPARVVEIRAAGPMTVYSVDVEAAHAVWANGLAVFTGGKTDES